MNKNKVDMNQFILPLILLLPALFVFKGGYAQWVVGYLYLFIIQGYAAWLLFFKAGQPFYGYSATMALGAYTCVILQRFSNISPILQILIGGLLSSLLAVIFYLSISRSRGFYAGMASFLLAILMPKLIEALYPITGGRSGVQINSLNISLNSANYFLVIVFVTTAIVFSIVLLTKTRMGKIWTLISENEDLAESIGINSFHYKSLAYFIMGLISGFGGALYVNYTSSISSVDINVFTAVSIFFIPLLGSKRSMFGPLIGALFIVLFPELFTSLERYIEIIYGLAYILVMIFLPNGLIEDIGRVLKKLYFRVFLGKKLENNQFH